MRSYFSFLVIIAGYDVFESADKLVETGEDREWVFVGYGFDRLVILK